MSNDTILQAKKDAFLNAFGLIGTVSAAARATGVARQTHYDWMKIKEYAEAFARKTIEAAERLEEEARRRAVAGVDRPLTYQGQITMVRDQNGKPILDPNTGKQQPVTVKDYSDTLLIFLMKGAMPQKYRDKIEHSGPRGGPIPIEGTILVIGGTKEDYISTLQQAQELTNGHD